MEGVHTVSVKYSFNDNLVDGPYFDVGIKINYTMYMLNTTLQL